MIQKSYSRAIVSSYFVEQGLPEPVFELQFAPPRKWRFDVAFPEARVAMEIQGGVFINGRHNRGAALLKEWEKLNSAAALGWRILYVQPSELCLLSTVEMLRGAITNFADSKPTAANEQTA